MKQRKKRVFLAVLVATLLLAVCFCVSFALSAYALQVTHYELRSAAITEPIRIVQLTDLHNSQFGEGNRRLLDRIAGQTPDLILITGDLLNGYEARTDVAVELIENLSEIAPVYVSFGNHEIEHEKRFGSEFRALYSSAGAVVLDYDWVDVQLNGQVLRIGGIYGYCLPEELLETGEAREAECVFLRNFQNTEQYKILLCHMPVCWIRNGSLDSWDVDLVLSGHSHGGQIRLPWIGGLWAPDEGWFPGRVSGLYFSEDGRRAMALSRGLGSVEQIPRLNNIPEILVLDLVPEK